MSAEIFIQAAAAETQIGDLDATWRAWLDLETPPPPPTRSKDEWDRKTRAVVENVTQTVRPGDRPSTGLILATTKGDIDRQVDWMQRADSAAAGAPLWPLGSQAAALAKAARLGGAAYAVSTACTSGLVALIDAAISVRNQDGTQVVAIGADEATSFVQEGFQALHAVSSTICRPFDRDRSGLVLGSAAAGILVGSSPSRENHSDAIAITGYGISNDATHMTAPDPTAAGLIRAIEQALTMAKLDPAEIDVLLAHGTATRYNDAMEAAAIGKIFLSAGRKGPAVTAVKSLLGHTLGASGLVEAALATRIFESQIIPKILHLERPEDLSIDFVTANRRARVRHLLKTASGFGGFNAAIIFSAVER